MTYVNMLALAGAIGFLGASIRLYISSPQAGRLLGFCAFILAGVAIPWLANSGPGLLRLFFVSGFLYCFCGWNRPTGKWLGHGLPAAVFFGFAAGSPLAFIQLWIPWLVIMAVGWGADLSFPGRKNPSYRPIPVFRRGLITACLALAICLPLRKSGLGPFFGSPEEWAPAKSFFNLTDSESPGLGDVGLRERFESSPAPEKAFEPSILNTAWVNIRRHPGRWFSKWRANINRMVFDFPYTHSTGIPAATGTGNRAFLSYALFLMAVGSVYPALRAYKLIPVEITLILIWTFTGLFIRSFFSAGQTAVLAGVPGLVLAVVIIFFFAVPIRIVRERPVPSISRTPS